MSLIPINQSQIESEYRQSGGNIPVFSGSKYQIGHGLGSIFAGLLKSAMPLVKQGAKQLGRTALRAGKNIISDTIRGGSLKNSIKKNLRNSGRQLLHQSMNRLSSKPRPRRRQPNIITKRKRKRPNLSQARNAKRRTFKGDIFE